MERLTWWGAGPILTNRGRALSPHLLELFVRTDVQAASSIKNDCQTFIY